MQIQTLDINLKTHYSAELRILLLGCLLIIVEILLLVDGIYLMAQVTKYFLEVVQELGGVYGNR